MTEYVELPWSYEFPVNLCRASLDLGGRGTSGGQGSKPAGQSTTPPSLYARLAFQ